MVLFGSAVTGEFLAKHSDLNILCIVERADAAELERLHPVAEWWARQGNPAPLIFTFDELHRSADIFAIELWDMKQRHRMLFGADFLDEFEVPLVCTGCRSNESCALDGCGCGRRFLTAPQDARAIWASCSHPNSTFCILFRHALMALGQTAVASKREAVQGMATLTGADPSGFNAILDLREGKRKEKEIDVEAALQTYLEFVEVVTNEVDRRLEAA